MIKLVFPFMVLTGEFCFVIKNHKNTEYVQIQIRKLLYTFIVRIRKQKCNLSTPVIVQ